MAPVVLDDAVIARLETLDAVGAPAPTSRARLRYGSPWRPFPACRRWPASTPPSTPRMPAAAATYALPAEWRARWGVRRFGFHGLSHAWASARRPRDHRPGPPRVAGGHLSLGAGASACAVRDGRSVDTTMGFTPVEGLVMATRSGSVDPGLDPVADPHRRSRPGRGGCGVGAAIRARRPVGDRRGHALRWWRRPPAATTGPAWPSTCGSSDCARPSPP